ncbi:MAG: helix-turn-helix domain-containing protein [Archaeoglobaceae archaeon]|nr:helix-turn-helix domain-containing protein [Archaeoglobaceae archaeon]MDW7990270.1 helix-turn-helix domain-containing protein [Archaeoglobaceae archaeon]
MNTARIIASLVLDENFGKRLETVIKKELQMDIRDFAKEARISESTIYKLISGKREPNLKTLRQIARIIERRFSRDEEFIAVVASRSVLNMLLSYSIEIDEKKIAVREYSANSFEDAIISAVKAEREGARAIVCAPILSPTLEKIVSIPIVTIIPKEDLMNAIRLAAQKVISLK